jgi:hypothetical protein
MPSPIISSYPEPLNNNYATASWSENPEVPPRHPNLTPNLPVEASWIIVKIVPSKISEPMLKIRAFRSLV